MSGSVGDNTARASGVIASAGGGTILSVKSLKVTHAFSRTGTTPTQMSQFDMSFAATESDSKLLFQCWLSTGSNTASTTGYDFYDVTNGAIVGAYADAAGSRQRVSWGSDVDFYHRYTQCGFGTWHEPGTTSSIDYTIRGAADAADTLYINRSGFDADTGIIEDQRAASVFIITEFAASAVTLI